MCTHQVENRHFHHALVEVGSPVFDDLHSHDFLRLQILAFYHLAEGTLAEDIEDEITVPG